MSTHIRRLVLSFCLLLAATAAGADQKQPPTGAGLMGATAIVNEVNVKAGTVTLWVHNTKHAHTFQVSTTCLYDPSIGTLAGVHPNMHVLVWTQAGQAGTLPVIYRLAVQPR